MRPIKLRMKAFISYKDEQTIDFSKFTDGLFLIEGDIGAGKTTIFDAISFALYGEPSGDARVVEDLHCNLVSKAVDTEVELVFSQSGKEYTVKRSILYSKTRGTDNYKFKKQEATLNEAGKVIEGQRKVTDRIVEIVGLNKEQFEKIVMLAQGEFKKFLEANSSEKETILQKIIDISEYARYQNILAESRTKLGKAREANDIAIKNHMESAFEHPVYGEDFSEKMFLYSNPDLLHNLSVLKETDEILLKKVQQEAKDKDEEIKSLIHRRTKAESDNQNIATLEERRNHLKELEEKSSEMTELQKKLDEVSVVVSRILHVSNKLDELKIKKGKTIEEIERLRVAGDTLEEKLQEFEQLVEEDKEVIEKIETLKSKAATKKALLGQYDEYQELLSVIESERTRINNDKATLETIKSKLDKLKEKEKNLTEERETIKNPGDERNKAENALKDAENKRSSLNDLVKTCNEIRGGESELFDTAKKVEKLLSVFESKEKEYDAKMRLFIESQSALIAKDLGKKLEDKGRATCPVCGTELLSGKDYHLAKPDEKHITEEELNEYKTALNAAESAWKEKDNSYRADKSSIETKKEAAEKSAKAIFDDCSQWDDLTEEYLRCKSESVEKEHEKCNDMLEQKKREENRAKELDSVIVEVRSDIADSDLKIIELNTSTSHAEKELKTKLNKAEELAKNLEFSSKEEAEREIATIEVEVNTEQEKVDLHKKELEELKNNQTRIKTSLDEKTAQKTELEEEIGDTDVELKEALLANGFKSREDALQVVEEIQNPEQWIRSTGEEINNYYNDVKITENLISDLRKKTEGLVIVNVEEISDVIKKSEFELEECQGIVRENVSKRDNHARAYEVVKENKEKNASTEHAWNILNRLSSMAVGAKSETGKMSFERFIMGAFFSELLDKANNKLIKLTGGHYQLSHLTTAERVNAAAGLDVEVINMDKSVAISKGSLSGGEKFLASLALALGLSDMAQSRYGGQTLDSLFIDEGFGSLDENSLSMTMNVLTSLTNEGNRLVGLISHVDVSEYPIAHKLHVEKKDSASRIV